MKISIRQYISLLFVICVVSVNASTLKQAKALYEKQKYEEAVVAFKKLYAKNSSNKKNATINHWLGMSLFETGNIEESIKYFKYASSKDIAESDYYLAKIAYDKHNYNDAYSHMNKYMEVMHENDVEYPEEMNDFMDLVRSAKTMYEHVEKLTVIDSLVVDKADFFKAYKLSDETGKFVTSDNLPYAQPDSITAVFMPQSGDRMMWASTDSLGISCLMETSRLLDGTWEPYQKEDEILSNNGEVSYPFMMPDGSTLYYAYNGPGSLGGYDIYLSRKNAEDGTYYQPQNLGMPYNSEFDDYLLVIDEMTGVGWWATDRNQIPGKVTIYVFIPNTVRQNYSIDDPNLHMYAKLNSIKDTWEEGADYSEYLERIASIKNHDEQEDDGFKFEISKGVIYTSLDDAKSSEGRNYLEQYMEVAESQKNIVEELNELRAQYHNASKSEQAELKSKIIKKEKDLLKRNDELQYLSNSVIKAETKKK